MRFRSITLAALCNLAACGGSGTDDLTATYGLRAQAYAFMNLMPSIQVPDSNGLGWFGCVPLIVRYAIRAESGTFPADVQATHVSLTKGGQVVWRQSVQASESGLGSAWTTANDWLSLIGSTDGNPPPGTVTEQVLVGVARGCSPPSLQSADLVQVSVRVEAGVREASVSVIVAIESAH